MPRRLVYAPRAFVFTKNAAGTINNVSDYVTSGTCQRLTDQASSASVTLRNPKKVFTTPSNEGGPTFHPMDGITIFLERLKGYPVQVFTGYLDDTPYYQMFPGTITIQATCTIKKLMYTYFDPALPYVNAFLASMGWINFQDGTLRQGGAFGGNQGTVKGGNLSDASLGKLLYATLTEIGEWDDTHVWIENLPGGVDGLAARIAKLMAQLQTAEKAAADEFTAFMTSVLGAGSQGSGGGAAGGGGTDAHPTGNVTELKKIVPAMVAIANQHGLPPQFVLAVWSCEGMQTGSSPPAYTPVASYGYFQFTSATPYPGITIKFPADALDLGIATNTFCKAAANYAQNNGINKNDQAGWRLWAKGTQGSDGYPHTWDTGMSNASQWLTQYGGITNGLGSFGNNPGQPFGASTQSGSASGSKANTGSTVKVVFPLKAGSYVSQSSWKLDDGVDISTNGGACGANAPLLAIADGTVVGHGIQGFGADAPTLKLDNPIQGYSYVYYGHSGPTGAVPIGTHVTAGQVIGSVGCGIVGFSTGPHLEIGFASGVGQPAGLISASEMQSVLNSAIAGQPVPGTGGGSAGNGTTGNITSNSAFAFTGVLDFPSIQDMTNAILLGSAHKGLMHDQQLLPFVQQITKASMRSFQSLPNGDFFAFYPDYFGEFNQHPAYWDIKNIEILSGDIYLNDSSLVTHQYVVGDNNYPLDNTLMNQLFSSGVITIFNAFSPGVSVINTIKDTNKLTKKDKGLIDVMAQSEAIEFIKRYGARPQVADYPQVRSSLYEMFIAYQQFMLAWATQFRSTFSFTFMPEIYPGGKVSFSDHGLQMYVESVTHSWDYESGFTTDAVLMAPSQLPGHSNPELPPNMVQALVEPVRSAAKANTKVNTQEPPPNTVARYKYVKAHNPHSDGS